MTPPQWRLSADWPGVAGSSKDEGCGVVSFQGDFAEHVSTFDRLGIRCRRVRRPEELTGLLGLVIPGGESTTIGMLMERSGLFAAIPGFVEAGGSIFGTCAGAILLSRRIIGLEQKSLALLPADVERNAYGRQIDSFTAPVPVPLLGADPISGVFIRAPILRNAEPEVEVLGELDGAPVLVRAGRVLASTFHPELTSDARVHALFAGMAGLMEPIL